MAALLKMANGLGYMVEYGETVRIFDNPQAPEIQRYIRGEFS